MSEALCGPSNALQQFKQQTSHDRTLQQDRLAARHKPAQGFRSVDPNAGLLDPEFEAFQAGLPPAQLQHFPPAHQQAFRPPGFAQSQAAPSWASDFQRMSIASPPPAQQQHFTPQSSTPDWAQDFRGHITQSAPRAQTSATTPWAFQQQARYGSPAFQYNNFAQPAFVPAQQQGKGKGRAVEEFDESAFAAAFDQAHRDMQEDTLAEDISQKFVDPSLAEEAHGVTKADLQLAHETAQRQNSEFDLHDDGSTLLEVQELERSFAAEEAARLEEEQKTNDEVRNDDDALAATAQELLEKVEHNQSEKFKNSQFLSLMRKLRDREVKVEGDKMVETNVTASSTSTANPLNASSSMPLFNNTEQTPVPLDTRPPDYFIPPAEQDHDYNRYAHPNDGQDVVNLLRHPDDSIASSAGEMSTGPIGPGIENLDDIDRRRYSDLWRRMLPGGENVASTEYWSPGGFHYPQARPVV